MQWYLLVLTFLILSSLSRQTLGSAMPYTLSHLSYYFCCVTASRFLATPLNMWLAVNLPPTNFSPSTSSSSHSAQIWPLWKNQSLSLEDEQWRFPGLQSVLLQKKRCHFISSWGTLKICSPLLYSLTRRPTLQGEVSVPSEDLRALSPPFPVETPPQPQSAEQPPTSHLMLFN